MEVDPAAESDSGGSEVSFNFSTMDFHSQLGRKEVAPAVGGAKTVIPTGSVGLPAPNACPEQWLKSF